MNALHAPTLLAPLVQQFFTERLIAQRNVSPRTVAAYRDTFRLLLVWFEQKLHKAPSRLALTDLDVTRISAFLDYLEIERHNTIRSRNARFAALPLLSQLCGAQRARRPRHHPGSARCPDEAL